MASGRIDKRAALEANRILRSKTASKEEKEAAAADLAKAENRSRTDPSGSASGEPPLSKGAARAARRASGTDLAQRRGGGRGR